MAGGLIFDAMIRRNSTVPEDLFIAHIGFMDTFARGLLCAHAMLEESDLPRMKNARYQSWESAEAKRFEAGKMDLSALRAVALKNSGLAKTSGKQEKYENLCNQYLR